MPANLIDERLVSLITHDRAEVDVLNSTRGISDAALHEGLDRSYEIILEACRLPVQSVAGAFAVISLYIDEPELIGFTPCGEEFRALLLA